MKSPVLLLLLSLSVFANAQIAIFDSLDLVKSEVIYFDFGKFDLRPEADSTLETLAEIAKSTEALTIHLTAHTDAIGSDTDNMALSQNRADTTKKRLAEYGIADSLLIIQSFGESKPVDDNVSDQGRQQNRRVTIDIYTQTPYLYLSGQVKDKESGEGIEANILIKQKGKRDSVQTDASGNFKIPVPKDAVVGLEIYAEGFFFESQVLKAEAKQQKMLEFQLPKIEKGASIDIKNLYFVGDRAILLDRSKKELPKVLKFMELNPSIKVEIAGHINLPNTPPVSKNSWHFDLSVRRAETVYSYLRRNGIPSERLEFKGYGNYQMRFPRARSSREQELNRRVEIRVLETGERIGKIGADGY